MVRLSVNLISEDGLKYASAFCRVKHEGRASVLQEDTAGN